MSYRYETQSRGVGAVAARDLSGFWGTVKRYGRKVGIARKRRKEPLKVYARRSHGASRKIVIPRRAGPLIRSPSRTVIIRPKYPPPRTGPVMRPAVPVRKPAVVRETARAGTKPAGILIGSPPSTSEPVRVSAKKFAATHTPAGPTLADAIARRNAKRDAVEEVDRAEVEIGVPRVSPSRVPLVVGGALAGLGALYLIFRK